MRKRHFFVVTYFFAFSLAHAFSSGPNGDFDFYLNSSKEYLDNDILLTDLFLDSALAIAIENGRKDQLGIVTNQKGIVSLRKGELDSAEYYYLKSLDYLEEYPDSLKVRPLKNLGVVAYFRGDMQTAIEKHLEVLVYYLEVQNATEIARIYSNLGVFYKNNGQFILASQSYIKSLDYFEIIGDRVGIANTNSNIGSIYVDLERYNEALTYFSMAISLSENGSIEDKAIWHHNMSIPLRELGMPDSAAYYQKIALEYRLQLGDSSSISQSYHEFGLIHFSRQDYPKAREYVQLAYQIAKRIGDVKYQAVTLNSLAGIELQTSNPQNALNLLTSYGNIRAPLQIQSRVIKEKHLADSYHQLGNDVMALKHLRLYERISDSLKNADLNHQLDQLNTYYESQKKEQTIKEQALAIEEANAKYQSDLRSIVIIIGFIMTIAVSLLARLWYQNIKKKNLLLKGRVDIAKNQMSPEFLYESLDIVSDLLDHDQAEAEQAVYKLSSLYQKMVENFKEDLIPLSEELDLLHAYTDLMAMRRKIRFEYTCDILNIEKYAVVPFSFLMLFENAIVSQEIDTSQHIKLYDSENSFVVENISTGEVVGEVPQAKASFPFIDQKYKVVCGRGISFEQPNYRRLIKIPKIEWHYA